MSAKASGNDAGASGSGDGDGAKHRAHHDGSASRSYTVEQKTAVIRVRKCSPTAFYDILGLEESKKSCGEAEIKKAYRKLSLLTHPDKNGYDGADEAFKMVSRAFQILSDPDKKSKFDRFGGDPDNRFGSSSSASPFSGFARSPGARGGPDGSMFEDEMSPEEMFRQFFGGGFGGFAFDTGPQFVFNMGGPGGIRVTQFGGARPRRRPHAGQQQADAEAPSASNLLTFLLPFLLLFVFPLISSLFSGSSTAAGPSFRMDHSRPPHTTKKVTTKLKIPFWINPSDVQDYSKSNWRDLENRVEYRFMSDLNHNCQVEKHQQEELVMEAQGWFFTDEAKLEKARKMDMKACRRLEELAPRRSYY